MVLVNKNSVNTLIFTLTEKSRLVNPFYLFSFTNDSTEKVTLFNMADTSGYPRRYNEMILEDGTAATTCAYAFALSVADIQVDISGLTIAINTQPPQGIASGTFIGLDYTVDKYVGGILVETQSGTTVDVEVNVLMSYELCTLVVSLTVNYSDGAYTNLTLPYQVIDPNEALSISASRGPSVSTFDCDTLSVDISGPTAPPGYTLEPAWLNGDLSLNTLGNAFSGFYPYSITDYDLYFSWQLDSADWNLPSSVVSETLASLAFHSIEGTLNPSLGQVDLEYGWGKYEVYESVTQTLDIADTTGRIIEQGIYFVDGYPLDSNNDNNIPNIYL